MKTIQIKEPKVLKSVLNQQEREAGSVKIKVSKAALSKTDLSLYMGLSNVEYPITPSHCAIGFVSEADEDSDFKLGARVAISPYFLSSTQTGRRKAVEVMGITTDGLLCDFVNVNSESVFLLPEGITDEEALFLDYIAFGEKVFESCDFDKGDYVAIVGKGVFQLILAQLAIYYQIVPIVISSESENISLSRDLGIYYTIDSTLEKVSERVKEITGGRMAEFSVFLPKELPFKICEEVTMYGGEIVVAGFDKVSAKHNIDTQKLLRKQLSIVSVNNGYNEMASAINLLANKRIKTDGLVTKTISSSAVSALFKDWSQNQNKYGKVVVNMDD